MNKQDCPGCPACDPEDPALVEVVGPKYGSPYKGVLCCARVRVEFDERELYLLLHAMDDAARRAYWSSRSIGRPGTAFEPEGEEKAREDAKKKELWALVNKLSEAGASYVFPIR